MRYFWVVVWDEFLILGLTFGGRRWILVLDLRSFFWILDLRTDFWWEEVVPEDLDFSGERHSANFLIGGFARKL